MVATAVADFSSLPAATQANHVASDQPQLTAIDPQAADQVAGLGDLDSPATSLTSGMLPSGMLRNATVGEVDAIFAQGLV
jgi:hypothetical protein